MGPKNTWNALQKSFDFWILFFNGISYLVLQHLRFNCLSTTIKHFLCAQRYEKDREVHCPRRAYKWAGLTATEYLKCKEDQNKGLAQIPKKSAAKVFASVLSNHCSSDRRQKSTLTLILPAVSCLWIQRLYLELRRTKIRIGYWDEAKSPKWSHLC